MCRLIWGFTGRTYHIIGNLMSRLILSESGYQTEDKSRNVPNKWITSVGTTKRSIWQVSGFDECDQQLLCLPLVFYSKPYSTQVLWWYLIIVVFVWYTVEARVYRSKGVCTWNRSNEIMKSIALALNKRNRWYRVMGLKILGRVCAHGNIYIMHKIIYFSRKPEKRS